MSYSRIGLAILVMAPLVAQSPKDVLKWIPATAEQLEMTWDPANSEARYHKAMADLDPTGNLMGLESKTHVTVSDLSSGAVVVATFPAPEAQDAKPKLNAKGKVKKEPSWEVCFLPVKDPAPFKAKHKVKADGAYFRYGWTGAEGQENRWVVFKEGLAIISARKALLDQVLKGGPALDAELEPLYPWMKSYVSVNVLTAAGSTSFLRAAMKGFQDGLAARGGDESTAKLMAPMQEWMKKAQFSIRHMALGLDVMEGGTLRVSGKAFYKAGSPLALEAAEPSTLKGSPLGALPDGPFAMAMGGQWPDVFDVFQTAALQDPSLTPAKQKELQGILEKGKGLVEGTAFCISHSASGDPFLSGVTTLTTVKDSAAWFKWIEAQDPFTEARWKTAFHVEYGTLNGRPTRTMTMDPGVFAQGKVPPAQVTMFSALLFGGTRMTLSYSALDDHTVLMVFGGKELLEKAATRIKQAKPLVMSAGMEKLQALLPAQARFGIYLQPKGFQDWFSSITAAIGIPSSPAQSNVDAPPLGGVITVDPSGMTFTGAATQETLVAFKTVFKSIGEAFPSKGKDAPSEASE
jgi:hypothetical protein